MTNADKRILTDKNLRKVTALQSRINNLEAQMAQGSVDQDAKIKLLAAAGNTEDDLIAAMESMGDSGFYDPLTIADAVSYAFAKPTERHNFFDDIPTVTDDTVSEDQYDENNNVFRVPPKRI